MHQEQEVMLTNNNDNTINTITAVATPPGVGAVAIIRISGPKTNSIIKKIFIPKKAKTTKKTPLKSHKMYYGTIIDENHQIIDEVMCVLMNKPHSYTCEDTAEIHCHGGLATVAAVLGTLLENGATLAQPGEFTKRAFLNGRIDLIQAEAVMELISAKNNLARRATLRKLAGGLSSKIKQARQQILLWLANIELSIDYPEHEEEASNLATIQQDCGVLLQTLTNLAATANIGNFIKTGVPTAIIGKPNVGKSSLMNAILQAERAIVTEIPGTTRDTLTENVSVRNIPIQLTDTAGIRQNKVDKVEQLGIDRSLALAESSELVLFVLDISEQLQPEDTAIMHLLQNQDNKKIILLNKADLPPKCEWENFNTSENPENPENSNKSNIFQNTPTIKISAKTGTGLNELYATIEKMFVSENIAIDDDIITKERDKLLLQTAISQLNTAMTEITQGVPEDIISISLRAAYIALGEILGETVADDIVDKIFAEFCVGK